MIVSKLKTTIDEWGKILVAGGIERFLNLYGAETFLAEEKKLEVIIKASATEPVPMPKWCVGKDFGSLWFFKGCIYRVWYPGDEPHYSYEQTQLLIYELYDKERKKFEKLRQLYKPDCSEQPSNHREKIPERVRIEVWRRDDGKCAKCGSRERLEYDHIVPVSRGGSNTARNIELLCEKCNRAKSNHIE